MRDLKLAICDYSNNVICNIYDSLSDVSGQAVDVHIKTEQRNGWKELSFTVPSVCYSEDGQKEKNYRLQYLIADYKIRAIENGKTDWFIISGPKVTHNAFSQDVSVNAGHISQRLKMKNLDLEFSDEEGNNLGTPDTFLDVILKGTGWTKGNVAIFYEDDGESIKKRTLNASAKTGAFKLIADMCELFDAKPVFNGDMTIDILPLNPFSYEITYNEQGVMQVRKPINLEEGEIPPIVLNGNRVLEMYYGNNVKGITRTLNSENIVTKLTAQGASLGSEYDGYCFLNTAYHNEYTLNVTAPSKEQMFVDTDGTPRYFIVPDAGTYKYSDLDPASCSYVYSQVYRINESTPYYEDSRNKAYRVYNKPKTTNFVELEKPKPQKVENMVKYLMDFTYFDKIGLLTEEMFQDVAKFQQKIPELYKDARTAQEFFNESLMSMSDIGNPMTGFAKLNIESIGEDANGRLKVYLKTDGAIRDNDEPYIAYRSDYIEQFRKRFTWHVASKLNNYGEPESGIGSILFIVHNTTPATYEMTYLKEIDERKKIVDGEEVYDDYVYGVSDGKPETFVCWDKKADLNIAQEDRYYLLCSKSIMGRLGSLQMQDEALLQTLSSNTKTVTELHPTYFEIKTSQTPSQTTNNISTYGWCYLYNKTSTEIGTFFICYRYIDNLWYKLWYQDNEPENCSNGDYFLNRETRQFYHRESGVWKLWDSVDDKTMATQTGKVINSCLERERIYKGLYRRYVYGNNSTSLGIGNYAIRTDYGFYWIFSLENTTKWLWIDTETAYVFLSNQTRVSGEELDYNSYDRIAIRETRQDESVSYPSENIIKDSHMVKGTINADTGAEVDYNDAVRSGYISISENTVYETNLRTSFANVFAYDYHKNYIPNGNLGIDENTGKFITPNHTQYIRFVVSTGSVTPSGFSPFIRVENYNNKIYVKDKLYTILNSNSIEPTGSLLGINNLTKQFSDAADNTYENFLLAVLNIEQQIEEKTNDLAISLGDIYREGWWQNSDYVEGDEKKLYKDTLDNIKEISKPEATYDIDYLDLYGSNLGDNFTIEEANQIEWPDIEATDAVHLIDPEIDVNLWAYLDIVDVCYDKEWETSAQVNTKLSLIGQHSFTDIMSAIAEVVNTTKSRQTVYERASAIGTNGKIATENLEGQILANVNLINGGATNWYTDSRGNLIFESADGTSAMKLSGYGWCIAESRNEDGTWLWRESATGSGITADAITTGYLSSKVIEAGTITADKLSSAVGQELDLSSNNSLNLYATVDGERPAGSLKTGRLNTGDAIISIVAGTSEEPEASININSGGKINIKSGSSIDIESNGKINVDGGSIDIKSTGTFSLDSNNITIKSSNFNVYKNGSEWVVNITGKINATSGQIGTGDKYWTIGDKSIYNGPNSLGATTEGAYVGVDGIWIYKNATANIKLETSSGNLTVKAGKTKVGEVITPQSGATYADGVYFGSDGIALGYTPVTENNTTKYYDAFSVTKNGTLVARDATISGKITTTSGSIGTWNIGTDYIGNESTLNSSTVGLANKIGNNIVFWAGNVYNGTDNNTPYFYVTANGKVHAKNIEITGGSLDASNITVSNLTADMITSGTFNATVMGAISIATSQITSGTISADLIYGGTLDANNMTVSNLSADDISGGTLKLGGESNANGTIDIYNSLKNKVGTWDNTGFKIYSTTNQDEATFEIDCANSKIKVGSFAFDKYGLVYTSKDNGIESNMQIGNYDNMYSSQNIRSGIYVQANRYTYDETNYWRYGSLHFMTKCDGDERWLHMSPVDIEYDSSSGQIDYQPVALYSQNDFTLGTYMYPFSKVYTDEIISPASTGSGAPRIDFRLGEYSHGLGSNDFILSIWKHSPYSSNSEVAIIPNSQNGYTYVCDLGGSFNHSFHNVYAQSFITTSSRNRKHNIVSLEDKGDLLDNLNPVSFVYNDDKSETLHFGLIYEDTLSIIPEICINDCINYVELVPILIKEIQDLRKRVTKLES